MRKSAAVLAALGLLAAAPGAAQAQGNPLSSIFSCAAPGRAQGNAAVIGAIAGGALGNQVADNERTLGTIVGAAAGAALGSYIGCRMQTTDQQRAEAAAMAALDRGQSQAWTNPQTGAQGRINLISSQPYNGGALMQQASAPNRPVNMAGLRFAAGVEPLRAYVSDTDRYSAAGAVAVRATPSNRAQMLGQLRSGETIDALARVEGTDWILAGRNGQAIGYVDDMGLRRTSQQAAGQPGRMCRTFDQTFTARSGQPETQRYTACQQASGEWLVVS